MPRPLAIAVEAPGAAITERTPVALKLVIGLLCALMGAAFWAGQAIQAQTDQIRMLTARVARIECHLDAKDCGK